ncbi:hypothetical protein Tco_1504331 [Tanacetum coccineum]
MHPGKNQFEHIDEFHKLVGDLTAIDTAISDEDQALLLLTSLPSSYDNIVETLLYGRDTLKLEDVLATLNSRELQKMTEAKGDGGKKQQIQVLYMSVRGSFEEGLSQDWIMDSGGSYHITYRRDYFVDFEEYDGGNIMLGDGRECRIRGTGKVQVQMRDGSSFVLDNVRYVLELRRNMISLGTLEKEGFTVKMQSGKIKGRIDSIDKDTDITLVSVSAGEDAGEEMLVDEEEDTVKDVAKEVVEVINTAKLIIDVAQVSAASDKVSTASAATTVTAAITTTADDLTLAQALQELKSTKPKVKGIVFKKPVESTTTISSQQLQDTGLSQDKRKGILIDEEERIARAEEEKIDEANIAWDDIQAKVDADYQLAERLQAGEQEQFTIEEKATLFKELIEQRRKHFAAKRAEEKRNKPPTKTQQKKTMITYLKNMEDVVEGRSKKQERVTIDAIPLVVKSPRIVDWKIYKEGKKSYYQIVRADEKSQMYMIFSHMLKGFDKEDLEDLYKRYSMKESTSIQSVGMEVISLLWSTFIKDATYADLHVGREEEMIVGIKNLFNAASITVALIDVNAAQSKLCKVNDAEGVNVASEEVSTAELVSTAYVICMRYLIRQ